MDILEKNDRFLRQLDILNPDACNVPICIIGAGATGSFVALSLAKMGFEDIRIYDDDTVEEHNFPNQLFPIEAKGKKKTEAIVEVVKSFTGVVIKQMPIKYVNQPLKGIVISALDTMKGRKQIYNTACKNDKVKLLIDPRTGAEMFRLFSVDVRLEGDRKKYEKHLHSDAEADETPCTARSIIYSVLVVSAFICRQVRLYCMNKEYKKDLIMDLNNNLMLTL